MWKRAQTDEGQTYYYNSVTGVSSWTVPEEAVEPNVSLSESHPDVSKASHAQKSEQSKQSSSKAELGGGEEAKSTTDKTQDSDQPAPNKFSNDGSFMEQFLKMQKQQADEKQQEGDSDSKSTEQKKENESDETEVSKDISESKMGALKKRKASNSDLADSAAQPAPIPPVAHQQPAYNAYYSQEQQQQQQQLHPSQGYYYPQQQQHHPHQYYTQQQQQQQQYNHPYYQQQPGGEGGSAGPAVPSEPVALTLAEKMAAAAKDRQKTLQSKRAKKQSSADGGGEDEAGGGGVRGGYLKLVKELGKNDKTGEGGGKWLVR